MEPDGIYSYTAMNTAVQAIPHIGAHPVPLGLNPPTSLRVLATLDRVLTPPHSLVLQPSRAAIKAGAYDSLAAHCLNEAHKPDPEKAWAYQACADVIRQHSKSFYFSAKLLPPGKREGIMALYAFCRTSDDIVDTADTETAGGAGLAKTQAAIVLRQWAKATETPTPGAKDPVILAWADTRNRYGIPQTLAEELLAGIRMDLTINRYETWDDLWLYCYRVASTVGLMSMYITGCETMEAVPFAVQLGVALQLTNILRDVGEDARSGRIYIPAEDMASFGYTDEMLMEGKNNAAFRKLMDFEIARARALYEASWTGIKMLPRDSRMAVMAAGTLYKGILDKILKANYDVFTHRAHLSSIEKVRALPALWLRANVGR